MAKSFLPSVRSFWKAPRLTAQTEKRAAMPAQKLDRYFQNAHLQTAALESLHDWFVAEELRLYNDSLRAFSGSPDAQEQLRYFERIDDQLTRYWQVWRPYNRLDCWPPQKIFETIKRKFAEFSWGGAITLVNFSNSGKVGLLRSRLPTMGRIKPKQGYPHMAVSKFLHFYNPALFPIYDEAMIWNRVLDGCFRTEFGAHCGNSTYRNDDTEIFLLRYMGWASTLSCLGGIPDSCACSPIGSVVNPVRGRPIGSLIR
jgi:hypothetical protein